jgi:hypothetical protein
MPNRKMITMQAVKSTPHTMEKELLWHQNVIFRKIGSILAELVRQQLWIRKAL